MRRLALPYIKNYYKANKTSVWYTDRQANGTEHRTLETWFMIKLALHVVREENELGQFIHK